MGKRGPNQRPSTKNPTSRNPVVRRPRRRIGQEHSLSGARTHGGLLTRAVARNHQLSASTWFRYRDTCSKRFFDFHRIGRKRTFLKELTTEEGKIKGQEDLAHYVRSFYTHLHTLEASAPGTSEARDVATPLWVKWEDETPTPKVGDLESSGTPECLELDRKVQNTLH